MLLVFFYEILSIKKTQRKAVISLMSLCSKVFSKWKIPDFPVVFTSDPPEENLFTKAIYHVEIDCFVIYYRPGYTQPHTVYTHTIYTLLLLVILQS